MFICDGFTSAMADKYLRRTGNDISVGSGKSLFNTVLNLNTVFILVKISPGVAPVFNRCIDCLRIVIAYNFGLCAVNCLIQLHGRSYAGTHAILIIKVIPVLDYGDVSFGNILIRDYVGRLIFSIGIAYRCSQILIRACCDDNRNSDRSAGLNPLAAGICLCYGVGIGAGILVVCVSEADFFRTVCRNAGVFRQRGFDGIAFNIVAGGIFSGCYIEDEHFVVFGCGLSVKKSLLYEDLGSNTKSLYIYFIGFQSEVKWIDGRVCNICKSIGKSICIACHFVSPVFVEGGFVC